MQTDGPIYDIEDAAAQTAIAALQTTVAGHTASIATNAANIAANTSDITANTSAISAHASDFADAYSASATYAVGDYCIYANQLYRCTTAITTAEAWTAEHWTATNVGDEIAATQNIASDTWDSSEVPYAVGTYAIYSNSLWKCLTENSNPPSEGTDWTSVKLTEIVGTTANPQYELLWVNNTINLGNVTNASATVTGKSFADYNVFLMFYKNLWGSDGTDSDWLTQLVFKGVPTRLNMKGYVPTVSGYDLWRVCTIADETTTGLTPNTLTVKRKVNGSYTCPTDKCVPMRVYGLKNVSFDSWQGTS